MREAVFEILERINNIEDEATRARAIWDANQSVGRFQELLFYGLKEGLEFELPEGSAPYKPCDEVTSHALLWSEIRKLYLFTKGNTLTDMRRQQLFVGLLEYIHPKDAELVLAIKDRNWPFDNINADLINRIFPDLLNKNLAAGGALV